MIQSTEGKSSADGEAASLSDETKLIIGWMVGAVLISRPVTF